MIFINGIKNIFKFQIFSFIFVCILGTLLHFTFEWSENNKVVAAFSSINESTWEHLKLLFFPMLISTVVGYFLIGRTMPNFICAKTLGIVYALSFVTIFFYTYTGILGTNYAILDIGSFFVGAFIGEYVALRKMLSFNECNNTFSIVTLIILLITFIIFTYFPLKINYFKDPINNTYGVEKNTK